MPDDRLAVISDVHGNRWALEAVLADIEHRGVDDIVNLGDSLYGPLDPAGTAERLLPLKLPTVRGNEDRLIVEALTDLDESETLGFVKEQLTSEHLTWLGALPLTAVARQRFFLCHGTPKRDDEYLLTEVRKTGVVTRETEELTARMANVTQPILLCAHDHVARTVRLPEGRFIVNPGSVGLPAYTDEVPFPHAMEAGSPHARYSIISKTEVERQVENVAIDYDWESAAAVAEANDRSDWAQWLRTGRATVR